MNSFWQSNNQIELILCISNTLQICEESKNMISEEQIQHAEKNGDFIRVTRWKIQGLDGNDTIGTLKYHISLRNQVPAWSIVIMRGQHGGLLKTDQRLSELKKDPRLESISVWVSGKLCGGGLANARYNVERCTFEFFDSNCFKIEAEIRHSSSFHVSCRSDAK